jgi:hypothetical protein
MSKNEHGSSDGVFILVVVLVVILAIIVWTNVSQDTHLGQRFMQTFSKIWFWIRDIFNAVIARFN